LDIDIHIFRITDTSKKKPQIDAALKAIMFCPKFPGEPPEKLQMKNLPNLQNTVNAGFHVMDDNLF
jgi:hypothetical protein